MEQYIADSGKNYFRRIIRLCIKQWLKDGKIPHFQRLGLEEGYTELVVSGGYEKLSETVANNLSEAIEMEKKFYENQDENSESGI